MQQKFEKSQCYFCCEKCLNFCMMRSLHNKYNQDNYQQKKVQQIQKFILNKSSGINSKFQEIQYLNSNNQQLKKYHNKEKRNQAFQQLLQYYKFRIFVPVFAYAASTETLHTYYYERLKIHYNCIKKKLNITIEYTDQTMLKSWTSSTENVPLEDSNMLKGVLTTENNDSFREYKTQSKALAQIVGLMKKNENFMKIKPFKSEDYVYCQNQTLDEFSDSQQIRKNQKNLRISHRKQSTNLYKFIRGQQNFKGISSQIAVRYKQRSDFRQLDHQSNRQEVPLMKNSHQKFRQANSSQIKVNFNSEIAFQYKKGLSSKKDKNIQKNKRNSQSEAVLRGIKVHKKSVSELIKNTARSKEKQKNTGLLKKEQNHRTNKIKNKIYSNQSSNVNRTSFYNNYNSSRSNYNSNFHVNDRKNSLRNETIGVCGIKLNNQRVYQPIQKFTSKQDQYHQFHSPIIGYSNKIQINKNDNLTSIRQKKLQIIKCKNLKKNNN